METLKRQFRARLSAFLHGAGLRPTTFGMNAPGNPNLFRQIDGGRSASLRTADRILDFMAEDNTNPGRAQNARRRQRRKLSLRAENEDAHDEAEAETIGATPAGGRSRSGSVSRELSQWSRKNRPTRSSAGKPAYPPWPHSVWLPEGLAGGCAPFDPQHRNGAP